MALTKRKKRLISRNDDEVSFRDDKLFIIASDDTYAPKQYFDFFSFPKVKVEVIQTVDGTCSASHVLQRVLDVDYYDSDMDDELWIILDTDHYIEGSHQKSFNKAIRRAKQKGVKVALSKPCFEFWLLLHAQDIDDIDSLKNLKNAKETEKLLRTLLEEYNKTNLKPAHFPPSSVVQAYKRSEILDQNTGGDIPKSNTSRIYLLIKSILSSALKSGLVPEFQKLKKELP